MTLEESVGQMSLSAASRPAWGQSWLHSTRWGLSAVRPGFADKTAQQVWMTSKHCGRLRHPLLIGTDEEGGTVVRASSNPDLFSSGACQPCDLVRPGWMDLILQMPDRRA